MSIYFDHNATTPPHEAVVRIYSQVMEQSPGNPSSLHCHGQEALRILDTARQRLATALDCRADEITFTSGATESNNMVLRGLVEAQLRMGKALCDLHIVTSAIEHSSILNPLADLETQGLQVTYVPAQWDGRVNARQVEASLRENTILVSIMLANNDTGVIQPLEDIARLVRLRNIPIHSDVTQAVGKIQVLPKALGLDYASLSAHKFNGPRGTGALWMRNGKKLLPLLRGGKQELNLRAGTENTPGCAAMGLALHLACESLAQYTSHTQQLREQLQTGLLQRFSDMRIYGELAPRVPNTLCVGFPGVDGMSLALQLDLAGFSISVGSACGAGDHEPSHVLRGMGCTEQEALSTVRFSLGCSNTPEEVQKLLYALETILPRLRRSYVHK